MLAAPDRPLPPPLSAPGLTTLVVYLRPTPRPSLVGPLAELGLFVHEVTADHLAGLLACEGTPPDFVTVVGHSCEADLDAVRDLSRRLTPAVLAIWPDNDDPEPVHAAGAMAVLTDTECATRLAVRVGAVARVARGLRDARERTRPDADLQPVGDPAEVP